MEANLIHEKAERIRDVIRYLKKFKNALVIIYIDDALMESPVFLSHIKDICLIHESGLKVIVVPGAANRISQVLDQANIKWYMHNNCRITKAEAMPLIKMAAFDVSNQVMTALAGEKKTALIGNWVRSRGKGVINGFDYGTSGEIDKLQIDAIQTVLNDGFIPIMPCIGWSQAGKPYNISSTQLAQQIASHLKADKLFYLVPDADITSETFCIPKDIGLSPEGNVPAMNLEELKEFFDINESSVGCNNSANEPLEASGESGKNGGLTNEPSVNFDGSKTETTDCSVVFKDKSVGCDSPRDKILTLLHLANKACNDGVSRVHILNGSLEGIVPCEIFSDLGSGTMIYRNNYGGLRQMTPDDIQSVLNLIQPFVDAGILLPRTKQMFADTYQHYIVYELDGAIRACSALIPYPDGQMEIAAVAVDKTYSHIGVGPKMMDYLIEKARSYGARSVFLLTTQTADWFENLGFEQDDISTLPEERMAKWTPDRGSKLLRIYL